MAGMDPLRYIKSTDPVEALLMYAIARHVLSLREQLHKNLASEIVNRLGESFKKG